jgi:hypothetical protein
LWMSDYKPF